MKYWIFTAVSAAALLLSGCGATVAPAERQITGGYVEQRVELPDKDFYCTAISPDAGGGVTLYGAESIDALYREDGWQGGTAGWTVRPDGTAEKLSLAWDDALADACAGGEYATSMPADEAGALYVPATRRDAAAGDEPFCLWKEENGALVPINVDLSGCALIPAGGEPGALCTLEGVTGDWIFVSASNGRWAVFSTDGRLANQYEASLLPGQGAATFQADAVRSGYVWACLNGSAPAYTLPEFEKASDLSLPVGRVFPDWEGEGFFHLSYSADAERILSHYTLSGDTREILMHGSDYAWGPESTNAYLGCAASDGAFWLIVETGGVQTLYRYVYDPDKTVEHTLTVFSLEESALVRQTIAVWNSLHPETRVEYTVGMDGAQAATRDDVIRQLNTELLAGAGPDVLIVDGLPADPLVEQGLLADMSGLSDWSAVRENVLASYTSGGGLYAVPAGMRAYIAGGRPDAVDDRLLSLEGIAGAMEEAVADEPCISFSGGLYEHLFDLFYPASADAVWADGAFQPDAYAAFVGQLNRIARAAGAETIEGYTARAEESGQGSTGGELYANFGAGSLNDFWNGGARWFAERWDSASQAGCFSVLERGEDGSLAAAPGEVTLYPIPGVEGPGVFEPLCAAAFPASGKQQALAAEFVRLMLSDGVQGAAGLDALPVTQSGLEAALGRVRETDPFTVTNGEDAFLDSLAAVTPDDVLWQAAREAAAQWHDGVLTEKEASEAVRSAAALRLAERG